MMPLKRGKEETQRGGPRKGEKGGEFQHKRGSPLRNRGSRGGGQGKIISKRLKARPRKRGGKQLSP